MNNTFFLLTGRIIACILLLALLIVYCGGGFKTDSPNAPQLENTIFGNDTLLE